MCQTGVKIGAEIYATSEKNGTKLGGANIYDTTYLFGRVPNDDGSNTDNKTTRETTQEKIENNTSVTMINKW